MTKARRAALICGLAESLKESVSDYEEAEAKTKWKPRWTRSDDRKLLRFYCPQVHDASSRTERTHP